MGIYGYCRVSTCEQHSDRQITNIKKYCSSIEEENLFIDKISGKTFERPEWSVLKRILRSGDELVVSEIDRLGRTKTGIKNELDFLKDKGVRLRALDIPSTLFDADGNEQKLIVDLITTILIEVYAMLAQQEIERKEMRQRQGIEEAKKRGVYKGRKPIEVDMVKFGDIYKRWKSGQLKTDEARNLIGLTNNTFSRIAKQYETEH